MSNLDTRSIELLICSFTVLISTIITIVMCVHRRYRIRKSKGIGGNHNLTKEAIYRKKISGDCSESSQHLKTVTQQPPGSKMFSIERDVYFMIEEDKMKLSKELQSEPESVQEHLMSLQREEEDKMDLSIELQSEPETVQENLMVLQREDLKEHENAGFESLSSSTNSSSDWCDLGGSQDSYRGAYGALKFDNVINDANDKPVAWTPPPPPPPPDPPNPNS